MFGTSEICQKSNETYPVKRNLNEDNVLKKRKVIY